MQRALCTFEGKGHPVQKTVPIIQALQKWVPIRLNFKWMLKFTQPRAAGFFTFRFILAWAGNDAAAVVELLGLR